MNLLIKNIKQLVTVNADGKTYKSGKEMRNLGIIENGTVLIQNGLFSWIGPNAEFRQTVDKDIDIIDASDLVALPGFVDSHTHLLFAESQDHQDAEITDCNFLETLQATRTSAKKELKKIARRHLDTMLKHGTTTAEIKSGYGLTERDEIKMLETINDMSEESLTDIIPTFFGAQAVPPEFKENPDEYVDIICRRLLPYISKRKLAKFCDITCEQENFSFERCRKILETAKSFGLGIKINTDRLSQIDAFKLASEFNAISVDCLVQIDDEEIEALKQCGTIATILPGDSFTLHRSYAPARKIIDAGVPLAIASNFNPISCMSFSVPMMMTIGCTQMSMTPEEAISAATLNGAAAVGLSDKLGSIEIGKQADIVLYNIPNYRYLHYQFGTNHVCKVIKRGIYLDF